MLEKYNEQIHKLEYEIVKKENWIYHKLNNKLNELNGVSINPIQHRGGAKTPSDILLA